MALLDDVLQTRAARGARAETEWVGLVRGMAAGHAVSLQRLYERASRPVFTLALRLTGDREAAEEATLEAFHDLWRHAERYEPQTGPVLAWVMSQARARALTSGRNASRGRQNERKVLAALRTLSPVERYVIEEAYFSDLTYAELATRLGQPLGTVEMRVGRALQKLRAALAEGEQAS